MDSRRRSLAKSVSWRVCATFITACIAFVITGELRVAAEIGLADSLIKICVYYMHERFWGGLRFG